MARYEEVDGDFTEEISIYSDAIAAQQQVLVDCVAAEIEGINNLTELLK